MGPIKKEYKVAGMTCNHCRKHVEDALNSLDGVQATVTLEPATALVEFTKDVKSLQELQTIVAEDAGEYTLSE